MLKKLIVLNVLIISVLLLSGCGANINVKLPVAVGSAEVPPISIVVGDNPTAAPVASGTTPVQGIFSNNLLIYIVIGLVIVIALIALVAVASKNNNSNNNNQ